MTRRATAVLLHAALLCCGDGCGDSVAAPPDTETGTTTEAVDTTGGTVDPQTDTDGVAPTILDAPEAITPGSMLYVMVDQPLNMLTVRVGSEALAVDRFLMTDVPAGLFRVPADLDVGASTLRVEWRDEPALADTRPIDVVEPMLEDVAEDVGLDLVHDASGSPAECAESHTGVAWGDYDGDGVLDVYFGNVGSEGTLHRGRIRDDGLRFEEVTAVAGLDGIGSVAMATFVDLEGDGDADLYIGRRGENRVFRNLLSETGEAVFEEVGEALGLVVDSQRTMGVAFGDYDGDGDLDLYEVNHAFCFPQANAEVRARDHLFENVGGGFVERTAWVEAPVLESVGFSAAWLDTDRDGDLDLIVINDDVGGMIGQPNAHWRNDGPAEDGWQFTEVGEQTGLAIGGINGMGLAYGDLNDDGFVDVTFSNIGRNVLMLSNGDGTWFEAEDGPGRGQLPWERNSITWAVHLPDLDNDGDLDFYASGGRIKGQNPVVDALFLNEGDAVFVERTWSSGAADPEHGKASALVDFDGDGALDIVTTAWAEPVRVYRNRLATDNHWIALELEQPGPNRDALGSVVTLEAGGRTRTCFHSQRPSLGGGSQLGCHFGLGDSATIDSLRIQWPDGEEATYDPPAVDLRLRISR